MESNFSDQYFVSAMLAMRATQPRFGRYTRSPWDKGGYGGMSTYNKSPKDTTESRRAKRKKQRDARKHS